MLRKGVYVGLSRGGEDGFLSSSGIRRSWLHVLLGRLFLCRSLFVQNEWISMYWGIYSQFDFNPSPLVPMVWVSVGPWCWLIYRVRG